MPEPGSHKYDIKRTRLRDDYEQHGVTDRDAGEAANEQLQREHSPPRNEAGEPAGRRTPGPAGAQGVEKDAQGGGLDLRSSTFVAHDLLPARCSQDEDNLSPALEWSGVPEGARELALLCEDPDAPSGTFVHWVLSKLPPETSGLAEDDVPRTAVASRNSLGNARWDGPKPPVGDGAHRYFFRLYATDRPLDFEPESTADDLREALEGATLAHGTLVGLYER